MPMNMAYCRFENTLAALKECDEALQCDEALEEMSCAEKEACSKLVKLCRRIADDYGDAL